MHALKCVVSATTSRLRRRSPAVLLGAACLAWLALSAQPASAADGNGPVSGAAAGGTSSGGDGLEHCDKTLGVLRIDEDTNSNWYRYYGPKLGPTTPLLSLMIMQSNCFVVVERGTGERAVNAETQRARGDEARESGTRGKGQQVVADYLMKPEIVMAKKDNEGGKLALGNVFGKVLGGVTAGMKSSEAGAVLTLVDIRSTVRLAAAEGHAKDSSFRFGGGGFAGGVLGGGSAYSNTDEGKLITAAFADAYNKMVVALRQYKAQKVEGGLGEGGTLGVQGGSTKSSKAVGN